jgi:hypothetical protein
MPRNPNCKCPECNTPLYKRPVEIAKGWIYCSHTCANKKFKLKIKICKKCNKDFQPVHDTQVYCSKECVTQMLRGSQDKNRKPFRSSTYRNLYRLKEIFNFSTCMVEGCTYDKIFDLHRLVEGKKGGKYKVGNMFAICPNHHAEIHRKIVTVIKVNNHCLRVKYNS